jgi:hypothetical protein
MAIQPIQQFSYTTGKNSMDASLSLGDLEVKEVPTVRVHGMTLMNAHIRLKRVAG